MNVRRFTARTARDALSMVRLALGGDAVVLSTKPSGDGVEVLAMAPEGMRTIEEMAGQTPSRPKELSAAARDFEYSVLPDDVDEPRSTVASSSRKTAPRIEPSMGPQSVDDDVQRLSMSTLSFQDYVRERMLKRRQESMAAKSRAEAPVAVRAAETERTSVLEQRMSEGPLPRTHESISLTTPAALNPVSAPAKPVAASAAPMAAAPLREPPALRDAVTPGNDAMVQAAQSAQDAARARRDQVDMMNELRSVKGLIEQLLREARLRRR